VRFLVDAQLPLRLADLLRIAGHDVLHTIELPLANKTPDHALLLLAKEDQRIVVSKDRDFVDSHLLRGEPAQLLWVTTGNISNDRLLQLIESNLPTLQQEFANATFIEMSLTSLVIHH
jgi:predicted nuclease of predicted toxin-antitoxin system